MIDQRNIIICMKTLLPTEQGNAEAQLKLGDCYYYGYGAPIDMEKAVDWYIKAAEQGNIRAQKFLEYWFPKAAEQGDATLKFSLGLCFFDGKLVPKSIAKAKY